MAVEMHNKPTEAKQKTRDEAREFTLILGLVAVLLLTLF